jgi:hypothetical protein
VLGFLVAVVTGLAYLYGSGLVFRFHVDWRLERPDFQFRLNRAADFGMLFVWYLASAAMVLLGRKWHRA